MTISKSPFVLTFCLLAALSFFLGVAVWPGSGFCIAGVAIFALLALVTYRVNIKFSFYIFREEHAQKRNFVAELYALAFHEMQDCHSKANFTEPLFPVYPLLPPEALLTGKQLSSETISSYPHGPEWPRPYGTPSLFGLARMVTGKNDVHPKDCLSTFFTDEAVTVLHKLPNRYWFWQVVKGAAAVHQSTDFSEKIDVEVLKEVVKLLREELSKQREIDLDSNNWTMNDQVCAYWQAVGIFLYDETRATRVCNPIFERNTEFCLFD